MTHGTKRGVRPQEQILGGRCLKVASLIVAASGALLASGCDHRPERVQVSGIVLIDGRPLTRGNIKFVPEGGRPSAGRIDGQGRFTLTCYDGEDGAIPGKHRVQVSANRGISDSKIEWYAPRKYADFRTSGIEIEVTEPVDDLKIELKSDGKKLPYIEG